MGMLADTVELVIGVDTHKDTHTAAVVQAVSGAMLEQVTVPATPAGYRQLLQLADRHDGRRVWAIEGTGGYGAGLTRFLHAHAEQVVELDRPKRAARRHGARSDPWMRSGRPVKPWVVTSSPSPERLVIARRCRCGWPPAARRSRLRATPNASSTPRCRRPRQPPWTAAWPDHASPGRHLWAAPAAARLGCRDCRHRGQPARSGPPHPAPERRDR
jgi:hypothetical protein